MHPIAQTQLNAEGVAQAANTPTSAAKKNVSEGVTVSLSPEAFEFLQKAKKAEESNEPLDLKEIIERIKELQQQLLELYKQMALIMTSDLPESEKLEQLAPLQEEAIAVSKELQILIKQLEALFKQH